MRSTRILLASAASALLLPAAAPASAEEPAHVDVSMIARIEPTIVVPRLTYQPKEGIAVRLDLSNPSKVPVEIPGKCLTAEALIVQKVGAEKPLSGSGDLGGGKALTVPGGGIEKIDVEVSRLYRIREEGRYRISWECGEWMSPHYDFFLTGAYDREKDRIAVVTTDLGTMELVLMPEQAPEHVRTFVQLARSGFYDGSVFFRILPGVEADTGDPSGTGNGGWANQLGAEIDPTIHPGRGLVGAIRRESSVTSATMFFILLEAQAGFKGLHTFFAYVRGGMEVLDALSAVETSGGRGLGAFRPLKPVAIKKIEIKSP